jgi:hypothetical protein
LRLSLAEYTETIILKYLKNLSINNINHAF